MWLQFLARFDRAQVHVSVSDFAGAKKYGKSTENMGGCQGTLLDLSYCFYCTSMSMEVPFPGLHTARVAGSIPAPPTMH
ncbi:MAG: hypothetical protein ACREP1_01740, partial [Rhodanobacteraceae bacterium]